MSFDLSTSALRHIISLRDQKDSLVEQLGKVTAEIEAFLFGAPATPTKVKRGRKAKAVKTAPAVEKGKRLKHGAAKELILNGLKEARSVGIAVKDLAPKIGMKASTVHVWLGTAGKKLKEVQKVGPGIYRYAAAKAAPTTAAKAKSAASKAKRRNPLKRHSQAF